jgi:acyl-CoA reductase-like NAD-dependent aldehyde dehydrogenase
METMDDETREELIAKCGRELQTAAKLSPIQRREVFVRMRDLINGRSAEVVRALEVQRGLRAA